MNQVLRKTKGEHGLFTQMYHDCKLSETCSYT